MSLAFSVEGFLFKVQRTPFILDLVTAIVFLLAEESDRFASFVSFSRARTKLAAKLVFAHWFHYLWH